MEELLDPSRACCQTNKFKPVTHVIFDLDGTIMGISQLRYLKKKL